MKLFQEDPYKYQSQIALMQAALEEDVYGRPKDDFSLYGKHDIGNFLRGVHAFYKAPAGSPEQEKIRGKISGYGSASHIDLDQHIFPAVPPLSPDIHKAPDYVQDVYYMNEALKDGDIQKAKDLDTKLKNMDLKKLPKVYQEKIHYLTTLFDVYESSPDAQNLAAAQAAAESGTYAVFWSRTSGE